MTGEVSKIASAKPRPGNIILSLAALSAAVAVGYKLHVPNDEECPQAEKSEFAAPAGTARYFPDEQLPRIVGRNIVQKPGTPFG